MRHGFLTRMHRSPPLSVWLSDVTHICHLLMGAFPQQSCTCCSSMWPCAAETHVNVKIEMIPLGFVPRYSFIKGMSHRCCTVNHFIEIVLLVWSDYVMCFHRVDTNFGMEQNWNLVFTLAIILHHTSTSFSFNFIYSYQICLSFHCPIKTVFLQWV